MRLITIRVNLANSMYIMVNQVNRLHGPEKNGLWSLLTKECIKSTTIATNYGFRGRAFIEPGICSLQTIASICSHSFSSCQLPDFQANTLLCQRLFLTDSDPCTKSQILLSWGATVNMCCVCTVLLFSLFYSCVLKLLLE